MVKYVDSGMGDTSNGKKKVKKGFKEDRRANYEKMLAKKNGKIRGKEPAAAPKTARVKAVTFDSNALKDYVLTLHKRKNERRVQAFVDVKRKMRRDHARDRRQQREEARLAYNNYARVPILPNYTYKLPRYEESSSDSEHDDGTDDDEEHEVYDTVDDDVGGGHAPHGSHSDADGDDAETDLPWMFLGDGDASAQRAEDVACANTAEKKGTRAHGQKRRRTGDGGEEVADGTPLRTTEHERRRRRKLVTKASTRHTMPVGMTNAVSAEDESESRPAGGIDDDFVTVEVKPLFGCGGVRMNADGTPSSPAASAAKVVKGRRVVVGSGALPSQDFSDLPAVVEEELLRLRKETKGPTRTKPKLKMLKELQKIRKIRKYSRKGHGKKTTSGKRKNRKK